MRMCQSLHPLGLLQELIYAVVMPGLANWYADDCCRFLAARGLDPGPG